MTSQVSTEVNVGLALFHKMVDAQMEAAQWKAKYEELANQTLDSKLELAQQQAAGWWTKYVDARDLNIRHSKNHEELVARINDLSKFKSLYTCWTTLCDDPRFTDSLSDLMLIMKLSEPDLFAEYELHAKRCKNE